MKKNIIAFASFLTFVLLFVFKTDNVLALTHQCDLKTGAYCTACTFDVASYSCVVDPNQSTCTTYGMVNDSSGCALLPASTCLGDTMATSRINCSDAPTCAGSGASCNVNDGAQGECCDGFLCYSKKCQTPPSCQGLGKTCSPAMGGQGNCCNGYVCGAGSAICEKPAPSVKGFWCDTQSSKICETCYADDLTPHCNPPKYTDYDSCVTGCTTTSIPKEKENVDLSCPGDQTGIKTAIGCIHVLGGTNAFISDILKWAIGLGGGIALILMLYSGFMIMTSQGNPERLQAGRELLTSAIAGLILLIFSVFILKFIGVDILNLGRYGFGG